MALALCTATPQYAAAQTDDDMEEVQDNGGGLRRIVEQDGFTYYKENINHGIQVLDAGKRIIIPWQRGYMHVAYRAPFFSAMKRNRQGSEAQTHYRAVCRLDGTEIISADRQYTSIIYSKRFDHFTVKRGRYVGLCDADGRELVSTSYRYIRSSVNADRYFIGSDGSACGAHDMTTGKELISKKRGYTDIRFNPVRKFFAVEKNGRVGACLSDGREAVPPTWFSCIYNTSTRTWKVKHSQNSRWEDYDAPTP